MNAMGDDTRSRGSKSRDAFRTISEVAEELDLPQHVLRFWESKFNQIKPLKRGGNRRYYRPDDVVLLTVIKRLLHTEGYTIRGVQKLFKAQGLKATIEHVTASENTTLEPIVETFAPESNQDKHDLSAVQSAVLKLKKLRSSL
ncbi:MerR family transcriptional regulator [Kordiimonas aquimaris]|uniref:MerR family transcriptional regulator n=1 Tax=Kordiimonas aquimaris TaxID=707591 RepID=UPI0021D04131|nr:MerR family transcriptional regulator [Kordiimonas aquimaris]